MIVRYVIFIIFTSAANVFLCYYIVTFCAIYPFTSYGWAVSSIICLLAKLGVIETIGPLLGGVLRKVDKDGDR
jgi:hypothetical protein